VEGTTAPCYAENLVKVLESIYEGSFSAVRSGGCLSD